MEADLYFQSELIKTRIEIKDQTLSEISKELHDNIGQIVSVGIMQLNMCLNSEKPIQRNELSDLKDILAKSLDEIRILSRIISKDNLLQSNFIEAIKQDLERIKKLKKFNINIPFPEKFLKLTRSTICLFTAFFRKLYTTASSTRTAKNLK